MPFLPLLDTTFASPRIPEDEQTPWRSTAFQSRASTIPRNRTLPPETSPRSSEPASPGRHVEFALRLQTAETTYLSSGEQSPVRGRTLHRVPARERSTYRSSPRGTSRRDLQPTSTGFDQDELRERLLSQDLTATPAEYYDDTLLEPYPFERFKTRSLSAELSRTGTYASMDLDKFGGHRDTFAMMGLRRLHNRAVDLPHAFWQSLLCFLDFGTYKALRISCRNWSQAVTRARPIAMPYGNLLPSEILEKVYAQLEPIDFDSARHTCRAWMIASLEEKLLISMLQRAGWWAASQCDMARYTQVEGRKLSMVSAAWLLSKRLATECMLSSGQTRCTNIDEEDVEGKIANVKTANCALRLTSVTDFSELAQSASLSDEDPPLLFSVSICQRYLLVAKDQTIYVYTLNPPGLTPPHEYGGHFQHLSTIDCPERVLAMTMDTSCGRFAVAALLEDRNGFVCDLERSSGASPEPLATGPQGLPYSSQPANSSAQAVIDGPDADLLAWTTNESSSDYAHNPDFFSPSHTSRRVFQKLCSAYNPPTSVAICPQRRCVGFGNATGVELHWVDVLSGQDLQRWFPLSLASDFLYFIPNRTGIDNSRKLRMIASVVHPVQKRAIDSIYPGRVTRLMRTESWEVSSSGEPDAWKSDYHVSRLSSNASPTPRVPDHFRARPLSDGYSILFLDSNTGLLCLGGDKRPEFATTKLERRFLLRGPEEGMVPVVYTTATDLRWGARVVAGYVTEGDLDSSAEVWFFAVPPDLLAAHEGEKGKMVGGGGDLVPSKPTVVQGLFVGTVAQLVDLSIDAADGDLTIRAFSAEAEAFTWQIAGSNRRDVVRRAVLADGETIAFVTDSDDGEQDVEMTDADDGRGAWAEDFDGSFAQRRDDAPSREHSLDEDGDLVMREAPSPLPPTGPPHENDEGYASGNDQYPPPSPHHRDEGYESDSPNHEEFEQAGGTFAIHVPPVHGRWSESDTDWVPQYLAQHQTGIEDDGVGADLLGSTRLELEFMGEYLLGE